MTDPREQFKKLGVWTTKFWVDGVAYGGPSYDPSNDGRLTLFENAFGPLKGKRILELGPLEGGHTLQLVKRGASVLGIEGHEANYKRCLFIKELFHMDSAEFMLGDLREIDFTKLGRFDVIFNVGVLYHMDEPWNLLTALSSASTSMFIATHCADPDKANVIVKADGVRYRGSWWQEGPADEPLSGLQPLSFWPTPKDLTRMLIETGWRNVNWMDFNAAHTNGPLGCIQVDQSRSKLWPLKRQTVRGLSILPPARAPSQGIRL